jgi:hypothetical protein
MLTSVHGASTNQFHPLSPLRRLLRPKVFWRERFHHRGAVKHLQQRLLRCLTAVISTQDVRESARGLLALLVWGCLSLSLLLLGRPRHWALNENAPGMMACCAVRCAPHGTLATTHALASRPCPLRVQLPERWPARRQRTSIRQQRWRAVCGPNGSAIWEARVALTVLSPCRFQANARGQSMPAPSPLLLAHSDAVVLVEHTDGSVTLC